MKKTKQPMSVKRSHTLWRPHSVVIAIVLTSIVFLMIGNTAGLKKALDASTEEYVSDVAYQLTNDISSRIESIQTKLALLAKSVPYCPDEASLEEFLDDRQETLGFSLLALIDDEGNTFPEGLGRQELKDLSGIKDSFAGNNSVVYAEGQSLIFSAPVYEDGTVTRVLAGVRSKENIQALIQPKSFEGKGLSCIIDSSGNVVISPTDVKPFLQLDNIFHSESDSDARKSLIKMNNDLRHQSSGIFQFKAVDHTWLVMSYHPLGTNDWFLLTLVPADLIASQAETYVFRTYLIIAGITVIFTLFLIAVIHFYRSNRRQLEKLAFTDKLTGGMNDAAFQVAYQELAARMKPMACAVVFLNVKDFRLINENFGISTGDQTLRYIYQKLKEHIQPGELAARGNSDCFFLCLLETVPETIQSRLEQLVKSINSYNDYTDIEYNLAFHQGVYLVDDPALDVTIAQDRARTACRQQNAGSLCSFYTSEMTLQMKKEYELNSLFGTSLENQDFQVYLQPKVRLSDKKAVGAEALVRWIHPQRGVIFPSDFIPLFEQNGNICLLDIYVFEKVCIYLNQCIQEKKELIPISVNLSRVHFKNLNFLRDFSVLKEKYGIPDGLIEIELTESIFFDTPQRELVKNSITEMHRCGFGCSLDDFGVGYSALALLKDFDVDTIKLDRQFFSDITNAKAQKIISGFIRLAENLGIHVVAEGIETQEQIDILYNANCEMVQGYYFSKPLPIPDFEKWRESGF